VVTSSSFGVVWAGGHYVVVLRLGNELAAMRVTRDGEALDRKVLPLRAEVIDVATSGAEIVIAGNDTLLRIGTDLTVLGTTVLLAGRFSREDMSA